MMAEEGKGALAAAVQEILGAVIFENWLRFYFIVEKGENGAEPELFMEIPAKAMEKIAALFPRYLELAESMNGHPVDFSASRAAVLDYVARNLDGGQLPRGMAGKAMDSPEFQIKLQLFHIWTQLHEDQLDQGFLDFGAWRKLFEEWSQSDAARKLEATLKEGGSPI